MKNNIKVRTFLYEAHSPHVPLIDYVPGLTEDDAADTLIKYFYEYGKEDLDFQRYWEEDHLVLCGTRCVKYNDGLVQYLPVYHYIKQVDICDKEEWHKLR